MKIGINTFGLSGCFAEDLEGTLQKLKEIGISAIEPCVFFSKGAGIMGRIIKSGIKKSPTVGSSFFDEDVDRKIELIRHYGFEVRSMHLMVVNVLPSLLIKQSDAAIKCALENNIPYIVVSYNFSSIKKMRKYISALRATVKKAEVAGITVLFHNHEKELIEDHGDCVMDYVLREIPDIKIQLDLGWVKFTGKDCVETMRKYRDRIAILHFKDVIADANAANRKHCFTTIGEGSIPLSDIMEEAQSLELDEVGYVIDQDTSEHDMMQDILHGYQNILAGKRISS